MTTAALIIAGFIIGFLAFAGALATEEPEKERGFTLACALGHLISVALFYIAGAQ